MYRVSFNVDAEYLMFDFDNQSEALEFFYQCRRNKNLTEVTYKIM